MDDSDVISAEVAAAQGFACRRREDGCKQKYRHAGAQAEHAHAANASEGVRQLVI